MNAHILDRPVWSALSTRQSNVATGSPRALRFVPDIAPFVAARDDTRESMEELARLVPEGDFTILIQVGESPLPPGTRAETVATGVQMVAETLEPLEPPANVERLGAADVPEMIALATLTKPGPFRVRTNELGTFWGVKQNGRLLAMAGERMKMPGFTEVSGVCTHPDARGKGYAGILSRIVATQIQKRGETPFLHAYESNTPAVSLYETLGFRLRTTLTVTVLVRT